MHESLAGYVFVVEHLSAALKQPDWGNSWALFLRFC